MARREITEVFTPRNSVVNPAMYMTREHQEKMLLRSLQGGMNTLLFGSSGIGKSWLYKKVMQEVKLEYVDANCANGSRLGSLTDEICSTILGSGVPKKKGYKETKEANLNAAVAKGGLKHAAEYELSQNEPLLEAFELFNKSGKKKKIIVLDNLESVFGNERLMDELADIIILLDDARYAKYNVNLLIVGVPTDVLEYFSKAKNRQSVANRIDEVPLYAGLNSTKVRAFIARGFRFLGVEIDRMDLENLALHVHDVTLGIPQRLHEYCELLAYEIEDNDWKYDSKLLTKCNGLWLIRNLHNVYGLVEGHMNSKETAVARRNQVLFAIGRSSKQFFDAAVIEDIVCNEFPDTVKANMGIGQILKQLSSGANPILKTTHQVGTYCAVDPKVVMCIRTILYRKDGRVKKKDFKIA